MKFYIEKEIPMLENLVEFHRKSDGAAKKKETDNDLLSCLVPPTVKSCNQLKDILMIQQFILQYSHTYKSSI